MRWSLMKKSAVKWYMDRIEERKSIKLPACILNDDGLKYFDKVIATHNPLLISRFYKNFPKYISFKPFEMLSEKMKEKRIVSDTDTKLIDKLIGIVQKDPEHIFEFVGNYYYISDILDDMKKAKRLSRSVRISLILWVYLNIIELITKYFTDLMKENIIKNGMSAEFKDFLGFFRGGGHPPIGRMIYTLEKLDFLNGGDSIFSENKVLRNWVSHANIFYDKQRKKIVTIKGKEFSFEELKSEFQRLLDFLLEFIYRYNGSNCNFVSEIKKVFDGISRKFLRIGRAGDMGRVLNHLVFEWEKD